MKSTPITRRAATKYGSAPANMEVTIDAAGTTPARFERMTPLKKNEDLISGGGAASAGASLNSYKMNTGNDNDKEKPAITSTSTETTTTPDQTVDVEKTKTVVKPPERTPEGDAAYAALTPEQRAAQDEKYRNNPANQETVTYTEQETIPGTSTTTTKVTQDPIMVDVKADVTNAYSGRMGRRDVKAATKDEYRAGLRLDRITRRQNAMTERIDDRIDELIKKHEEATKAGKTDKADRIKKRIEKQTEKKAGVKDTKKYQRLGRKKAMFEKRLEAFGNYADQAVDVVGQHRKMGSTVRTGERQMEWSEVGNSTANVDAQKRLRNEMRGDTSSNTTVNTKSQYSDEAIADTMAMKKSNSPLNMWGNAKQSYGDGKSSFKMRGYMNKK